MVGETGWPSAGRAREDAVPSLVEEAKYLRLFMRDVAARGIDYNVIEAFDQPWKRHQEGAVGGYWGIFDGKRQQKFDWFGPVSNHPDWQQQAMLALVIGIGVLALTRFNAPAVTGRDLWLLSFLTFAGTSALLLQAERAGLIAVNNFDRVVEGGLLLQSLLLLTLALRGLGTLATAPLGETVDWLATRAGEIPLLALLRFAVFTGAATVALALAFDGRYRGFPIAAYGLAAILLTILQMRAHAFLATVNDGAIERGFSLILGACALYLIWLEGPKNLQAMSFAAILLLLAFTLAGAWRGVSVGASRLRVSG